MNVSCVYQVCPPGFLLEHGENALGAKSAHVLLHRALTQHLWPTDSSPGVSNILLGTQQPLV